MQAVILMGVVPLVFNRSFEAKAVGLLQQLKLGHATDNF